MLRDEIAPALRAAGMQRAGTTYSMPSASHWALLGFQRSTGNTAHRMKFTVNCKVVRRDAWDVAYAHKPYIGRQPKPNRFGGVGWQSRIGQLLPSGQDTWWWLEANGESRTVADQVIAAITQTALPAMFAEIAETA